MDPVAEDLPELFDPRVVEQLEGEGETKTLLMLMQSRAELIKDLEVLVNEESNPLGIEQDPLSELAFQQTLAIQKSQVCPCAAGLETETSRALWLVQLLS